MTKPTYGDKVVPEFDDEFVAPVMSVAVSYSPTQVISSPQRNGSCWLALAYPANAPDDEIQRWNALQPGHMIRVGTAASGGFTDYLTVMQVQDIDALVNTLPAVANVKQDATDVLLAGASCSCWRRIERVYA